MVMMKRLIFNLILFVYVATTYTEATNKCYVCGKGADEPFKADKSFSNHDDDMNGTATATVHQKYNFSSSCDMFDKSLSHENFIYECPSNYVGCFTQISGNDVMRTCDMYRINVCKTANGVQYCYCATDLCNGKIIEKNTPTMHRQLHKKFIQNSDDEDFMESSGMSESSLLHLNDEDDERGNDESSHAAADDGQNVNDDFHTENINHIDLSDPLWTTLASSTTNDNHNYHLTATENSSSSTSNLTAAKSQTSSLLLAGFNYNLLVFCVVYLILK